MVGGRSAKRSAGPRDATGARVTATIRGRPPTRLATILDGGGPWVASARMPSRSIPLRDPADAVVRCAPFRAALDVDPVGSAGAYDAFLCVEVALPWERDITRSEPFVSMLPEGVATVAALDGADGRRWRPVGLVPASESGLVTVLAFEPDPSVVARGAVGPLVRTEWRVEPGDVAGLCRALVGSDAEALAGYDRLRADDGPDLELMVCTHGRRDVCCGGAGTSLHDELSEVLVGDRSVRLWRCSHTGGHRFAPTALTFPDAYAWGHLDLAAATAIARRDGDAADVAGRCRGSSLVSGGPAQAADREALARRGWSWTATARTVEELPEGRVEVRSAEGDGFGLVVDVVAGALVPTPTCGIRPEDLSGGAVTSEPVWEVRSASEL